MYKEEAKAKMRLLTPEQKFLLIQQEKVRHREDQRNKDHSAAFFAKLLTGEHAGSPEQQAPPPPQLGVRASLVAPGSASKLQQEIVSKQGIALKDLQELHVVLRGALKDWLQEFVKEGALTSLLGLLSADQYADHSTLL